MCVQMMYIHISMCYLYLGLGVYVVFIEHTGIYRIQTLEEPRLIVTKTLRANTLNGY